MTIAGINTKTKKFERALNSAERMLTVFFWTAFNELGFPQSKEECQTNAFVRQFEVRTELANNGGKVDSAFSERLSEYAYCEASKIVEHVKNHRNEK